ncbi:MAG TPA: glycosyltransferase family 2 protein [Cyclobacteriaceae bacterium]|nr:glycosyltransferase family 2 protein [Cyclobacteriaceae bacterium]
MEMPLVSVIIPAYNRGHLIGETINSVINQTYDNWELIIVDDGSTDETKSTIEKFSDTRIQYHKINHSGLLGLVRNQGISHASGEYIAFLDSDDMWHPEKLQIQVKLFKTSPLTTFIITHIEFFGPAAHPVGNYPSLIAEDLLERYLEEHHFTFYPSTLVFKKTALAAASRLNEHQAFGADTEFFIQLCLNFKGSFIGERLVRIRKHSENTSSNNVIPGYFESIETLHKLFEKKHITKKTFQLTASKLYYKAGLILLRNEPREAAKLFRAYIAIKPLHWKGWVRLLQSLFQSLNSNL